MPHSACKDKKETESYALWSVWNSWRADEEHKNKLDNKIFFLLFGSIHNQLKNEKTL